MTSKINKKLIIFLSFLSKLDTNDLVKEKTEKADLVFVTSTPLDRWQCPNLEFTDFLTFLSSLSCREKIYLLGAHGTLDPEAVLKAVNVKG